MREIIVRENECGQRLDKLLRRYLRQAPDSFLYKMLRKKNITLNSKKATGRELTVAGDRIRIYLAEETYEKFAGADTRALPSAPPLPEEWILYEDGHVLAVNKPAGVLSQKGRPEDVSLNEQMSAYLLAKGELTEAQMAAYRPSVCNRLDRNTSGLLLAGKTLAGLQELSALLKEHRVKKEYLCMAVGEVRAPQYLEGSLEKDAKTNTVRIRKDGAPGGKTALTELEPLWTDGQLSLLRVRLITGRTHQIRAHLASIGHPILGDPKYGASDLCRRYSRAFQIHRQLLHAYQMEFPHLDGVLAPLSGRRLTASLPEDFAHIVEKQCGVSAETLASGTRRV